MEALLIFLALVMAFVCGVAGCWQLIRWSIPKPPEIDPAAHAHWTQGIERDARGRFVSPKLPKDIAARFDAAPEDPDNQAGPM